MKRVAIRAEILCRICGFGRFIALAALLLPLSATAQSGDTDLNGSLDLTDLNLLRDHIVFRSTLEGQALTNADLNLDGRVDAADVTALIVLLNEPDADPDGDGVPNSVETAMGTDPFNPDTDGDTILDGQEDQEGDLLPDWMEFVLGTDPSLPDTDGNGINDVDEDRDGDGLSDYNELLLGADFDNPDTDGDGFLDGDEAAEGSDPTSAASIPITAAQSPVVRYRFAGQTPNFTEITSAVTPPIRYRYINTEAQTPEFDSALSGVIKYRYLNIEEQTPEFSNVLSGTVRYRWNPQ